MYNNPLKDWMYFTRSQQRGIVVLCIMILILPAATRWILRTRTQNSLDAAWIVEEADRFRLYLAGLEKERAEQQEQQRQRHPRGSATAWQPAQEGTAALPSAGVDASTLINLNTTDSIELQQIRGIGPAFGRRIVLYRELLGGYHCITQLLEVFGMDSTRFENVKPYLEADATDIRKININDAAFGDLVRHPYIDRSLAGAILNLRRQHGPFTSIDDLDRSYLIDEETLDRIRIYLTLH